MNRNDINADHATEVRTEGRSALEPRVVRRRVTAVIDCSQQPKNVQRPDARCVHPSASTRRPKAPA